MLNIHRAFLHKQSLQTRLKAKRAVLTCAAFSLGISLQSCQKTDVLQPEAPAVSSNQTALPDVTEANRLQTIFAQALAKAIQADVPLRDYLKAEAVKQFDNDFDILYQVIKDQVVDGSTVHARLTKYIESPEDLVSIESRLPLLTIFVPTLPSGFSAKTWNTKADAPSVAVSQIGENVVPFYDGNGKAGSIQPEQIPGFPILLVKLNERVTTSGNGSSSKQSASSANLTFHQNKQFTFSFGADAFDNIHPASRVASRDATYGYTDTSRDIDVILRDAWYSGQDGVGQGYPETWHRDYIYYGIGYHAFFYATGDKDDTYHTSGPLKRNYRETIRSMKLSVDGLNKIADQSGDPRFVPAKTNINAPSWTDGYFEFKALVLYNAKDGTGDTFTRIFTARGQDLFDITYNRQGFYYTINSITPKEMNLNVPIATWDLNNYGIAWKFQFYEEDQQETVTSTESVVTTYAANFEVNVGDPKKIGAKFGASATTQNTKSIQVVKTLNSDYLGEAILKFSDPIVLTTKWGADSQIRWQTLDIDTGGGTGFLQVGVEPVKYY
jgi:hypothetical protein